MRGAPRSRVELYHCVGQGRRDKAHGRVLCIDGCSTSSLKDDQKLVWTREEFWGLVKQCISGLQGVRMARPLVGVYLDNSVLYVASVVACLALNCVFVPLHARYSKSRLAQVVAELGPSVVVVADRDVPGGLGVSFDGDCHMLCFSRSEMVSSTGLQCRVCEKENGIRKAKEVGKEKACGITDDTLYILYSSGTVSGGSQKPVYGSISVLMNRVKWQACEIPWREQGDVMSFHTPTCFVDHVCQIFGPLLAEKHVSILCIGLGVYIDPDKLVSMWQEYSCTHVTLTPTLWRRLLASVNRIEEFVKSVRVAISSGEVLYSDLLRRMQGVFGSQGTRIFNLYGTTASGGDCAYFDGTHFDTKSETTVHVPVGKPLSGFTIMVDDERGVCIAAQFHGIVITEYPGDVGFFDSDGNLVVTGRVGGLQKVHGELIDTDVLKSNIKAQVDGVLDVMFVPLTQYHSQIACFVFWRKDSVRFAQVRKQCRDVVGPGSFVTILDGNTDIPVNLSGKIDVKKLQLRVTRPNSSVSAENRGGFSEQRTMEILAECLDIPMDSFEATDSIFDLGATSSSVVAIANQLHVPVDEVYYHYNTARDLARRDRKRKVVHDSVPENAIYIKDHMLWNRDMGSCVDAPCRLLQHGEENGILLCCSHQGRLDGLSPDGSDVIFTLNIEDKISAAPVVLEGVIVIPGSTHGVTLVPEAHPGYIQHKVNLGARVSPCIVGTKVLFGTYDGYIVALDVRKVDQLHKLVNVSDPVACTLEYCQEAGRRNRCITATLRGEIIAFDMGTMMDSCFSKTAWNASVEDVVFAKPLYVKSSRYGQCVVTLSLHGKFHCFDLETGLRVFEDSLGEHSKFYIDPIRYKTKEEEHVVVVGQTGHMITVNLGTFSSTNSMALFPSTSGIQVYSICLAPNTNILLASCSDHLIRVIRLVEQNRSISLKVETCIYMPNSVHSLMISDSGLGYLGCRDNHVYCIDIDKVTKSTV